MATASATRSPRRSRYRPLSLDRFFLEIEEGPVVLIATRYRGIDNVMALSWLMPLQAVPPTPR